MLKCKICTSKSANFALLLYINHINNNITFKGYGNKNYNFSKNF